MPLMIGQSVVLEYRFSIQTVSTYNWFKLSGPSPQRHKLAVGLWNNCMNILSKIKSTILVDRVRPLTMLFYLFSLLFNKIIIYTGWQPTRFQWNLT